MSRCHLGHRPITLLFVAFFCGVTGCNQANRAPNVSGTWKATTTSSLGITAQNITLRQTGNTFDGEMITSQGAREPVKNGRVAGSHIEFIVARKRANERTDMVAYRGEIRGDHIAGTFVGQSGRTVNWTAQRQERSVP